MFPARTLLTPGDLAKTDVTSEKCLIVSRNILPTEFCCVPQLVSNYIYINSQIRCVLHFPPVNSETFLVGVRAVLGLPNTDFLGAHLLPVFVAENAQPTPFLRPEGGGKVCYLSIPLRAVPIPVFPFPSNHKIKSKSTRVLLWLANLPQCWAFMGHSPHLQTEEEMNCAGRNKM